MKISFFILFILFIQFSFAQHYRSEIIKKFDSIEYYPNSSIKCAYTKKHKKLNGYAIEFDENGLAKSIGKYKNGKKSGTWINEKFYSHYKKGEDGGIMAIPGCGTGKMKLEAEFTSLYYHLIGITVNPSEGHKDSIRDL